MANQHVGQVQTEHSSAATAAHPIGSTQQNRDGTNTQQNQYFLHLVVQIFFMILAFCYVLLIMLIFIIYFIVSYFFLFK